MSLSTVIVNSTMPFNPNAFSSIPSSKNQHLLLNENINLTQDQSIAKIDRFLEVLKTISYENHNFLDLNPLYEIFQIMTNEENETIKRALTKKQGFFVRIFSSESWDEWTDNKTALGKVTSLFHDHFSRSIDLSCIGKRLNTQIIQAATNEAVKVLKQLSSATLFEGNSEKRPVLVPSSLCSESLLFGATATVLSHNPLPIVFASLPCLTSVEAQRGNPNVAAQNRIENRRSQIKARKQRIISESDAAKPKLTQGQIPKIEVEKLNETEKKLLEELGDTLVRVYKRALKAKGWVDAIINGAKYSVVDFTQVDVPVSELIAALEKLENKYWHDIVFEKYIDVFPYPNQGWNRFGEIDYTYVINQMKDKLKSHGYNYVLFGTPIQFIDSLKNRGICEKPYCHHSEL